MAHEVQNELFGDDEMLPLFQAAAAREATSNDVETEPEGESDQPH